MDVFLAAIEWLLDGANWTGTDGVPHRLWEHLQISGFAVLIACLIALPPGLFIGHTRRGEFVVVSVANVGRAIPSFGILGIVFPFTLQFDAAIGFWATLIALVLLAIPPILTNSYVGIQQVEPELVEAGRGVGMRERQLLGKLEVPLAAPLIVTGVRGAAVAVVATATLGAVVGWGGLGRYIVDGFATQNPTKTLAGGSLVAALAIVTELAFEGVERIARRVAVPSSG